jgi:hypothetical protein
MNTVISRTCEALIFILPLSLLVVRFYWPKRMPWWLLFAATVVICSLLVTVIQSLTFKVDEEALAACLANPPPAPSPAVEPCPLWITEYAFLPWYMRWIGGIVVLAIGLAIYGVLHAFKSRRRKLAA